MEAVRRQPVAFRFAAAGVVLMLLGTIGAWTDVPVVGAIADRGEKLTVIGVAVLAALFLSHHTQEGGRTLGVAGMTLGVIGSVTCGLVLYDLLSEPFVSPGWGVYVSLLGSLALAGSSYMLWREETY
jgi:hypothetical protein